MLEPLTSLRNGTSEQPPTPSLSSGVQSPQGGPPEDLDGSEGGHLGRMWLNLGTAAPFAKNRLPKVLPCFLNGVVLKEASLIKNYLHS